jgi:hypothetical protein
MSIAASQQIWYNGDLIDWGSANVHILSTAVQFGMSMFEGIRKLICPPLCLSPWCCRCAHRLAVSMHSISAKMPGRLAPAQDATTRQRVQR